MKRGPYKPRAAPVPARTAAPAPGQQAVAEAERALLAAKRALKIKRARTGLRDFIELMMPDPEAPDDPDRSLFECQPHHRILLEMVERVERKETMRGAVSMPPQHGKSLTLSRFGLAWIIGRNPHMRILFATYADDLAKTRGAEVLAVLQSPVFRQIFPKATMRRGSQTKDEVAFEAGGSINFVGRGTGTTGRPADLFVIDDPYKDHIEGSSGTIRGQVKDWYNAVVFSRCHVLTPVLIVHTRWNEDDLLGWLTDPAHPENKARPDRIKRWRYVNLPTPVDDEALAAALGIPVGAPLWPDRFPLSHLKEAEENDPRIYAALYKGRPSPEDGDFFRAENIVTYTPDQLPPRSKLRFYAASDHAVTEKQRNDATCMGVAGVDAAGDIWILPDLWWRREKTDKVVEAMIDLMARWEPLWWRAATDHISKAIGPFLRKRMLERRVFCNVVESSEAGADKLKKAQAIQARMAMQKVRFPAYAPWFMEARSELLKFPHGKHDDFVDFLSHLGRGLRAAWGANPAALGVPGQPANDTQPKVGTLGWVKHAAERERRVANLAKRIRSF